MAYPAVFDLSTLDGSNGFVLNGAAADEFSGKSLSYGGDFNGDGRPDLMIGAWSAIETRGATYVVFGRDEPFEAESSLADLDGSNGFRISGIDPGDHTGVSVSVAGDINGDGFDDILIGGRYGIPGSANDAGAAYIVFGGAAGFAEDLNLADLDGSNGFALHGADGKGYAGWSVAGGGDVNNDGIDDFVIGAFSFYQNNRAYVVFGREGDWAADFSLDGLDGLNGFEVVRGSDPGNTGRSVAIGGDVNGDGIADMIVGENPGVIFGSSTGFEASVDLEKLDGTNGYSLSTSDRRNLGFSSSFAGDINGNGLDDIVLGSWDGPGARGYSGWGGGGVADPDAFGGANVFYGGRASRPGEVDLDTAERRDGFRILSIEEREYVSSVASAGDFNGDGFDDVIVGARGADPNGSSSGETYVIFGRRSGPNRRGPDERLFVDLDGTNGFRIDGLNAGDQSGDAVTPGDVNGDGYSDIIIGATLADVGDLANAGKTYVIFGGPPSAATVIIGSFVGQRMRGGVFDDTIRGESGSDTISGGGGGDSLNGSFLHNLFPDLGFDILDYRSSEDGVTIDLLRNTASGGDAEGDTIAGFEGVWGGEGDDRLRGDSDGNELTGGSGSDTLIGGSGFDSMAGGVGDDTYFRHDGRDVVTELADEGYDTVRSYLNYTADENIEVVRLMGDARIANGNTLDNRLVGRGGADSLRGAGGDDTLSGAQGSDELRGGAGSDLLLGGMGHDALNGGDGADRLLGYAGNDLLFGDNGNDTLFGGIGRDTITGGAGTDRFSFGKGDTGSSVAQADRITDFSQGDGDRIQLTSIDADSTSGGNQAFSFIGTGAFTTTAGELRYQQAGGETRILGDTDGDGSADIVVRLETIVTLTSGDFLL